MNSARQTPNVNPSPSTIPFPKSGPPPKVAFPFAMLPDVIAADRELSGNAKVLFSIILSSARRGHCYASNENLADRCGMSVIQVRRLLKVLEDRELIVRDLNSKDRDEIRVPMTCIKMMQVADQNDAGTGIKMMQVPASKRCTELEKRVENLEDSSSLPPDEEIDPQTLRWFGRLIAKERAEGGAK
jgi:hypothetical protein